MPSRKGFGVTKLWLYGAKSIRVSLRSGSWSDAFSLPLTGHTPDYLVVTNVRRDWFDIIAPLPDHADEISVKVDLLDAQGRVVSRPVSVYVMDPAWVSRQRRPTIVYAVVESLSDIHYLLQKGFISPETKKLYDNVFRDFISVENAVAQNDWTFPAVASYHTGLLMSQHRMYHSERIKNGQDRLHPGIVSLAQILKQNGYVTYSANLGKLRPENGFSRGVDYYYKPPSSLGFLEHTGDGAWAVQRLEQNPTNGFVHLHYDRLHHPLFSMNGPWSRARPAATPRLDAAGRLQDAALYYEANLRAVLYELNAVISYLKAAGRFEDTIMIVTGDHGMDFDEWLSQRQSDPLIEERTRVPYLINRRSGVSTRNASVRPFFELCDLLKIKTPAYCAALPQCDPYFDGYVFSESTLKSKDHMYILHLSDDQYTYVLHAHLDWSCFSIIELVDEKIFERDTNKVVKDKTVTAKMIAARERFFESTACFYKGMEG